MNPSRSTILLAVTDRACSQLDDGVSRPDLRFATQEISLAATRYGVILSPQEFDAIKADIKRRLQ